MKSISKTIEDTVVNILNNIVKELSEYDGSNIKPVIDMLGNSVDKIKDTRSPIVPTKRYVEAVNVLLQKIIRLKSVARGLKEGSITIEDLRRTVREYTEAVNFYKKVADTEHTRMLIYMIIPQTLFLATILYQFIILNIITPPNVLYIILPVVIASIAILPFNTIVSHIINIGAVGYEIHYLVTSNKVFESGTTSAIFLVSLYVLVIFMSISYIHLSYIASSKKYLSQIEKSINELFKAREAIERAGEQGLKEIDTSDLYIKLEKAYIRLYGEKGVKYLKYRLMLLTIIKGLTREAALRKIYGEIKDYIEAGKQ